MPLENYAEPEVAVAAVVVGAAASPSVRRVVRRSVVYGLAGALIAYDRASAAVRGVAQGVQNGVNNINAEQSTAKADAEENKDKAESAAASPAAP
jgi:hypothetical protein